MHHLLVLPKYIKLTLNKSLNYYSVFQLFCRVFMLNKLASIYMHISTYNYILLQNQHHLKHFTPIPSQIFITKLEDCDYVSIYGMAFIKILARY